MRRPLRSEEKALLDQMSRDADPSAELLEQLVHELAVSAVARHAFAAELARARKFLAAARGHRSRLPRSLASRLDAACPRVKSFDHLVALADQGLAPEPELADG